MAEKKFFSTQQERQSLTEKLWLAYFNSYLYEKGVITETERNKMIAKIESRKGSTCSMKEKEIP